MVLNFMGILDFRVVARIWGARPSVVLRSVPLRELIEVPLSLSSWHGGAGQLWYMEGDILRSKLEVFASLNVCQCSRTTQSLNG